MTSFRQVLEVLKYLPPKEVLRSSSFVSKEWTRVSNTSELWLEFCDLANFPDSLQYADLKESKTRFHIIHRIMHRFCLVSKTNILFRDYSKQTSTVMPLSKEQHFEPSYSSTFLHDGSLFICGGGTLICVEDAFSISPTTGIVQTREKMSVPRRYHGILTYQQSVYIFGGKGNFINLKSCEVWSTDTFEGEMWEQLPDMAYERLMFVPCVHRDEIFLCGGLTDKSEVFSIPRRSFRQLGFTLEITGTLSYIQDLTLIIISKTQTSTCGLDGSVQSTTPHEDLALYGNMNPIILSDYVLFPVVNDGVIRVLSLDKLLPGRASISNSRLVSDYKLPAF